MTGRMILGAVLGALVLALLPHPSYPWWTQVPAYSAAAMFGVWLAVATHRPDTTDRSTTEERNDR